MGLRGNGCPAGISQRQRCAGAAAEVGGTDGKPGRSQGQLRFWMLHTCQKNATDNRSDNIIITHHIHYCEHHHDNDH